MAKIDIAQNKLVYQIPKVSNVAYGLNAGELKKLLTPYNIDCKTFDGRGSCIPMLGKQNCYYQYMNAYIKGKFKKGFIDSLETVSLRNFLLKDNDEKCYEDIDRFYKLMYYAEAQSFETQQDEIIANFKASLKYPIGYILGKGQENWHAYLHFIIDAKANVHFIDVDVIFDESSNKKFESYFIDKIKQFISASKWIPAEIEGIKVSRRVVVGFNDYAASL